MREIKFKGYAIEEMVGNQWVYGGGVHKVEYTEEYAARTGIKEEWFLSTNSGWVQAVPESIGQYTGLKDKNRREIFEGDVVKGHWWEKGNKHRHIGVVSYVMNAFVVAGVKQYREFNDTYLNPTYEVIGNIYENPELAKGE